MGAHRAQESIKGRVEGGLYPVQGERAGMRPCGLFSLTCFFHHLETYGLGGGKYFSTAPDYHNDVTGIRVSVAPALGLIKSIQLRRGSSWTVRHGEEGGKVQEFLLRPGEHIIAVHGSYKGYLRYLVVHTDQGRLASFGQAEGNHFSAYPDQQWQVLTGVFGHHKLLGLTSIGFQWEEPRVSGLTNAQARANPQPEK
uniref:Jacalin-type lectin domain-containing protein n=1 Tax=Equus asinus TaxID=9793 RepID=A0A8C4LA72_EQUAS